jgi:hypothetical protein
MLNPFMISITIELHFSDMTSFMSLLSDKYSWLQLWSSSGIGDIACDVEACLQSGSQDEDILGIQDIQIDVIANGNAA